VKLRGARCLGVAGVPDGDYSFLDPATGAALDFVLVTGPSASGKTRLLEAIALAKEAIAPYGTLPETAHLIRRGSGGAKVVLAWEFDEEERGYAGLDEEPAETETIFEEGGVRPAPMNLAMLLARYVHRASRPRYAAPGKVEYFHAGRRVPWRAPNGTNEPEQRAHRAVRSDRKYAFVPTLVASLASSAASSADRESFEAFLGLFTDGCKLAPPSAGGAAFLSNGVARAGSELPSSDAHAVLVAATATVLGLDRSLVLVDRPELAGTGGGAARLIQAWRSLGQGAQVLAASSSTELVNALPPERVIRLAYEGAPA
jgi:energy-coupling factor transporter ATP-binding protein EcfA2